MTKEIIHGDQFRLLYFSPKPEDGERVCVAIVALVGGMWFVDFDEHFAKLKAVAKDKDIEFVRGVIEILQAELDRGDISSLMVSFEPQFRVSEPRKLLAPWTAEVRHMLHSRFLMRGKFREGTLEREHEEKLQLRIAGFMGEVVQGVDKLAITRVRPEQLFGSEFVDRFRNIRPVARAVVGRTQAVLIDGVDTSLKPSSDVIRKANRIAYTFWQYGRVVKSSFARQNALQKIYRVGIVFDGVPNTEMVREYSLHQFEKDADLALDSTNGDALRKMKEEIEKTLHEVEK